MKLATLKDGSRDGQLAVVSRDLSSAHLASHIAGTLQHVLDDWNFLSPQLEDLFAMLNGGKARHAFAFDPRQCMAPLPRAYQRLSSAGQRLTVGVSDDLLGPCDDAVIDAGDASIQVNAELAIVTGDLPLLHLGSDADSVLDGVRLLMLLSNWSQPAKPPALPFATACSPLAVTPDELGQAWRGGLVHLPLHSRCSGRMQAQTQTQVDVAKAMPLHFGQLMAQVLAVRRLRAGCIVGSGALLDLPADGEALRVGDSIGFEMLGRDGQSVFGAIEQRVTGPLGNPGS